MKLLLLSNSRNPGSKRFEHALPWITKHFENVKTILFIPYAVKDHDAYAKITAEAFALMGIKLISAHVFSNPLSLLESVDGIYVGGGNTFRLLDQLYETGLIQAISNKVKAGMPYMGVSAGINVVCPTIKTTNDMPIVFPRTLNAMGLISFQLNPHYYDPDPNSKHMGETREERLNEFHEENSTPVLGLREGSALSIVDTVIEILGPYSVRLFCKDRPAIELPPGLIRSFFN